MLPVDKAPKVTVVARCDYAISVGDMSLFATDAPPSLAACESMTELEWEGLHGSWSTGVCYRRSAVRLREIKDGVSNAYLIGEKYLNPAHYQDGSRRRR